MMTSRFCTWSLELSLPSPAFLQPTLSVVEAFPQPPSELDQPSQTFPEPTLVSMGSLSQALQLLGLQLPVFMQPATLSVGSLLPDPSQALLQLLRPLPDMQEDPHLLETPQAV
jgi:hypothetical protein